MKQYIVHINKYNLVTGVTQSISFTGTREFTIEAWGSHMKNFIGAATGSLGYTSLENEDFVLHSGVIKDTPLIVTWVEYPIVNIYAENIQQE